MPPRRIRFRPPPVELPAALGWALARAFGPPEAEVAPPRDPAAALAFAGRFEIAARLAARLPRERWAAELGEEGAAELRRQRIAAVANEVRLLDLAREVAHAAGAPVALLKFAALAASGAAATGSRPACDVDLLAPAAGADRLHAALRARGWSASPLPAGGHQLPALAPAAAGAAAVEIHLHLPGVRVAGRSATYEDLERAGLLAPLDGWPAACRVPGPAVLAAHALAHALVQHGFAPDAYGSLKMIGDLVDLGWGGDGGDELAARAGELVAADVSADEIQAARRLAAALAAGEGLAARLAAPGETAGEIVLLRHLLAGRLDPRYRAALKLGLRPQPGDAPRAVAAARALWAALFLSRAQVDAIYGRPGGGWGYLGRRLARPFDLALRLAAYAAAARRGFDETPRGARSESPPASPAPPEPTFPSRILPPP
jgi:hypothetical protein